MIQKIRQLKKIKNTDFNKTTQRRLIVCLMMMLGCAAVLGFHLIELQILHTDEMLEKLASFQNQFIAFELPRGKMKDRNGTTIVQNQKTISIIYTKNQQLNEIQLRSILTEFMNRILQKQDNHLIDEMLFQILTSNQDKVVIVEDVDESVAARLGEFKDIFFDFDYAFSLKRENMGNILTGMIGSVSEYGLPVEQKDYLQALGYSMNTVTGISGIEKEYETLLKGDFSLYKIDEDCYHLIQEGTQGADLVLSIDAQLQEKLEEVLIDTMESIEDHPARKTMNRILVMMSDPNTGDILAGTSIVRNDENEIFTDSAALFTYSYVPGSIVKGASLYAGLSEGAISANQYLLDEPLYIKGTKEKSSWKNLGLINDVEALAFSSNVYMMKTAILMGHGTYLRNQSLAVDDDLFDRLRNIFSEFGLGVITGSDFPDEQLGVLGNAENSGNVLDFVIGQYDTYTMIQLMQYINTIANGGKKLEPRLVLYATNQQGEILWRNDVTVLNQLDDLEALERVQQGFTQCVVHSQGLCRAIASSQVEIAAKTGTAQVNTLLRNSKGYTVSVSSVNNSAVAYAPVDDPKVTVACMIPNAWTGSQSQTNLCLSISKKLIEYFVEMNFS